MCDSRLCNRPAVGRLCADCLELTRISTTTRPGLLDDLRSIAGTLLDELNVTIVRSDRMGTASTGVISRGTEKPVMFNEHASDAMRLLRRVIAGQVRSMLVSYPHLRCHATNVRQAAAWLMLVPQLLADHPAAGEMRDEIRDAVWHAYRAVDRPADRVYVGQCTCGARIYAPDGSETATCFDCEATWDVEGSRDTLHRALEDEQAPVSVLVGLVTSMGKHLTRSMLAGWKRRGVGSLPPLVPAGLDEQGREVFRIGDVLDRLAESR